MAKSEKTGMDIDFKEFLKTLDLSDKRVDEASNLAINDMTDELTRIASDIAPIDKGTLRISNTKTTKKNWYNGMYEGSVSFSVLEDGFNYALYMHEGVYELGEQSKQATGTTGWSGKRYEVGRKYLQRPLDGEREAFIEFYRKSIDKAVEG